MGSTILFGRLNFDSGKLHYFGMKDVIEHRKKILLKVIDFDTDIKKVLILSGKKKYVKDSDWGFAGVKSQDKLIYGKLGKEKNKKILKRDKLTKDYIGDTIKDSFIARFLIDLETNVIAFESKKDVGDKTPLEIIQETFNAIHKDEHSKIEIITDKRKILERLKQFSILSSIEFTLHSANPHSTANSDNMDDFLKSGNIKSLKLNAQSDEKGMALDNVPLLKSALHMAQEGYGSAKAKGKVNNKKETLVTGNVPFKSDSNIGVDDDINMKVLLKDIRDVLKKLEEKLN